MKKTEIELYGVIVRLLLDELPPGMTGRMRNIYAVRIATRIVGELVAKPSLLDTLPPPPNVEGT